MRQYLKLIFLIISCSIIMLACDSRTGNLSTYYSRNISIHREMDEDASKLLLKYPEGIMIKKVGEKNEIFYMYAPANRSSYQNTIYDSELKITERSVEYESMQVPERLLMNFQKSIYHAIKIDSTGVFFAPEYLKWGW